LIETNSGVQLGSVNGVTSGREPARDIDEESPARCEHRRARGELEHGEPQRPHGVRHHLLMADGHVDVIGPIGGLRDRKERRDRPALDDVQGVAGQAPFDVLRAAEVTLDRAADTLEPHDLLVRQRLRVTSLDSELLLKGAALRARLHGELLGSELLLDERAVPHLVDVCVHSTGDERLAEAETSVDGRNLAVAGDGVGRKQDPGRIGKNHALHDDGEPDLPVLEAVLNAIGDRSIRKQRGPAARDVPQNLLSADDVQVRVVLAGERHGRRVFQRGARAHRACRAFSELRESA
jgi:hypothetical protein